uniref:Uncharacterized protein n=1 Tax=Panagrolaimus superbus TaxID=310955 RepID=A0A914ZB05_9BILA
MLSSKNNIYLLLILGCLMQFLMADLETHTISCVGKEPVPMGTLVILGGRDDPKWQGFTDEKGRIRIPKSKFDAQNIHILSPCVIDKVLEDACLPYHTANYSDVKQLQTIELFNKKFQLDGNCKL